MHCSAVSPHHSIYLCDLVIEFLTSLPLACVVAIDSWAAFLPTDLCPFTLTSRSGSCHSLVRNATIASCSNVWEEDFYLSKGAVHSGCGSLCLWSQHLGGWDRKVTKSLKPAWTAYELQSNQGCIVCFKKRKGLQLNLNVFTVWSFLSSPN